MWRWIFSQRQPVARAEAAALIGLSALLGVGTVVPGAGSPSPPVAEPVPAFAVTPALPPPDSAAPVVAAPAAPAPRLAQAQVSRARVPARVETVASAVGRDGWLLLADCESGYRDARGRVLRGSARWALDSGNGYYGGFQFSPESWAWTGGQGLPHEAPAAEQLQRAMILQRRIGWARAWPVCSRLLGLVRGT